MYLNEMMLIHKSKSKIKVVNKDISKSLIVNTEHDCTRFLWIEYNLFITTSGSDQTIYTSARAQLQKLFSQDYCEKK